MATQARWQRLASHASADTTSTTTATIQGLRLSATRDRIRLNVHYLETFWRRAVKAKTKDKRLALLIRFAGFQLLPPISRFTVDAVRLAFEDQKWANFHLCGGCWVCGLLAESRHHIIQLRFGGQNIPRNMVYLCNRCHDLVHEGDRVEFAQRRLHPQKEQN